MDLLRSCLIFKCLEIPQWPSLDFQCGSKMIREHTLYLVKVYFMAQEMDSLGECISLKSLRLLLFWSEFFIIVNQIQFSMSL